MVDLTMRTKEKLKYEFDRKGNRVCNTDSKYIPSPKFFHDVKPSGNIFLLQKEARESLEWRKTERYCRLCKRLYEDGLRELNNLRELDKKLSEEALLAHAKHCYDQGYMSENDYNYRKTHIREYRQMRRNEAMRGQQCSLDYKIELYDKIFNNGFRNFMEITLKYGHVVNGVQIIEYDSIYHDELERDKSFYIL